MNIEQLIAMEAMVQAQQHEYNLQQLPIKQVRGTTDTEEEWISKNLTLDAKGYAHIQVNWILKKQR